MQRTVDQSFEDVDAVLFVLSARERIGAGDRFIAERVFALGVPVVIALNKVDRLKPGHIAHADADRRGSSATSTRCIRSARRPATASPSCASELVDLLPEGPALLPAPTSAPTCRSSSQIAELIREKALQLTREELPHAISVEVEELGDKVVRATLSSRPSRRSRSSSARAGR